MLLFQHVNPVQQPPKPVLPFMFTNIALTASRIEIPQRSPFVLVISQSNPIHVLMGRSHLSFRNILAHLCARVTFQLQALDTTYRHSRPMTLLNFSLSNTASKRHNRIPQVYNGWSWFLQTSKTDSIHKNTRITRKFKRSPLLKRKRKRSFRSWSRYHC